MFVEVSVYTSQAPLAAADIIALAAKKKLELRFVIPFKCLGLDQQSLESPLRKQNLMGYCWPTSDRGATRILDKALANGDQKRGCIENCGGRSVNQPSMSPASCSSALSSSLMAA